LPDLKKHLKVKSKLLVIQNSENYVAPDQVKEIVNTFESSSKLYLIAAE
jgi:hypothetical protein